MLCAPGLVPFPPCVLFLGKNKANISTNYRESKEKKKNEDENTRKKKKVHSNQ